MAIPAAAAGPAMDALANTPSTAQRGTAAASALTALIPGKMEKALRRDLKADTARMNRGEGITGQQRQSMQAATSDAINAQQAQARAQVARGSMTGGASGQSAQQLGDIQRAGSMAAAKGTSNINALDSKVHQDLKNSVRSRQAEQMARNKANFGTAMKGIATVFSGGLIGSKLGKKKEGDLGQAAKDNLDGVKTVESATEVPDLQYKTPALTL